MSTIEALRSPPTAARGEDFEYRPLSTAAVASLVFGLLSSMMFVAARQSIEACLMLSPFPLLGMALAWSALARMRANPGQFSGAPFAWAGLAASIVCLVGGVGYAGFVYATEVPEGYSRTSFVHLKPSEVEERGNVVVPPDVATLDGKRVFIKGYIRPDSVIFNQNVGRFLLVRDNNQCCFGDLGTVKYFDQVAVTLKDRLRVDYSLALFGIGGILRVVPENASDPSRGPVYALEADYAK